MSKASSNLCVFSGNKIRNLLNGALLMLYGTVPVMAQNLPSTEYQVKAVFLYNFTQFISWPAPAFGGNKAPFVIGILGDDPFNGYLEETIQRETVQGHKIVTRKFRDVREVENCQILFISGDNSDQLKKTLSALPDAHTLTVGESYHFTKMGGMVRFFTRDNKIRFEINAQAAKAANLDISSKLLRVADIYSDTE